MTFDTVALLAQEEDGWGRLVWLLVFLVFPMLNKFGEKIRKWSAAKEEEKRAREGKLTETPKTPRGIARELQPAPPVLLQGERRVAPPSRPSRPPKAAVPVARTPKTVGQHPQHRPVSPVRQSMPVKARRVRPPKTRAKATPPPTLDARTERITASWHLTDNAPDESTAGQRTKRSTASALLSGRIDPHSFRSVVLLSEILRPPLALREGWPDES